MMPERKNLEDRRILEDRLRYLEYLIGRYEQAVQTEKADQKDPFLYKRKLEELKAEREKVLKKLGQTGSVALTTLKTASEIGKAVMTLLQLKTALLPGVILGAGIAMKIKGGESVRSEFIALLLAITILVSYISIKRTK